MKLLTAKQRAQMERNAQLEEGRADLKPVVKLFDPSGAATWLLTELDPDNCAFGLCDLGIGFPELGYVDLSELATFKGRFGLGIERDRYFKADKTLGEYTTEAVGVGRIQA